MKVAISIRESGTRQYKPASPRAMYPASVTKLRSSRWLFFEASRRQASVDETSDFRCR
jgi:hypothetical protein